MKKATKKAKRAKVVRIKTFQTWGCANITTGEMTFLARDRSSITATNAIASGERLARVRITEVVR